MTLRCEINWQSVNKGRQRGQTSKFQINPLTDNHQRLIVTKKGIMGPDLKTKN